MEEKVGHMVITDTETIQDTEMIRDTGMTQGACCLTLLEFLYLTISVSRDDLRYRDKSEIHITLQFLRFLKIF